MPGKFWPNHPQLAAAGQKDTAKQLLLIKDKPIATGTMVAFMYVMIDHAGNGLP